MGATNIFTYTLSGSSVTIVSSDNVQKLSVKCTSGSITFLGTNGFRGTPPATISLSAGSGITLTATATSNPLEGITINAALGTAEFIISTS